ncbi:MAG: hypothetical protein ACE5I1_03900 [bacterium]
MQNIALQNEALKTSPNRHSQDEIETEIKPELIRCAIEFHICALHKALTLASLQAERAEIYTLWKKLMLKLD